MGLYVFISVFKSLNSNAYFMVRKYGLSPLGARNVRTSYNVRTLKGL